MGPKMSVSLCLIVWLARTCSLTDVFTAFGVCVALRCQPVCFHVLVWAPMLPPTITTNHKSYIRLDQTFCGFSSWPHRTLIHRGHGTGYVGAPLLESRAPMILESEFYGVDSGVAGRQAGQTPLVSFSKRSSHNEFPTGMRSCLSLFWYGLG